MKATIIVGPQCSGKTTKARQMARARGAFDEADFESIESPFGLTAVLSRDAKTLIIDEPRQTLGAWSKLKALCTASEWMLPRKGHNPEFISARDVIVTTNELPHGMEFMGRHFQVIRL